MSRGPVLGLIGIIVVVVVGLSSLFTVDQTQQALITQFGKPVRVITQAGLHVKIPFVQSVYYFDRRLLNDDIPSDEVILGDQKRLIVNGFVRFRIINPLHFYQAVGVSERDILPRLTAVVSSSMRQVLGEHSLLNILSKNRDGIMGEIRREAAAEMKGFGIDVEDVRIRRADFPAENTAAVLKRMQSSRERVAAEERARGMEAALKIRAGADRDRTVLIAHAKAKAQALIGQGQAEAITIYGDAFSKDPHFFAVWRTLQAYRTSLASSRNHLVLTPHNRFLRDLETPPLPVLKPISPQASN